MVSYSLESDLLSGVSTLFYPQNLKLFPPSTQPQKLQHSEWYHANSLKVSKEVGDLPPKNIPRFQGVGRDELSIAGSGRIEKG